MTVLFLTIAKDGHLPYVQKHLSQEPIRIDLNDIIKGDELSFEISGGKQRVIYKGQELRNVSGVWVRRPAVLNRRYSPPVADEWTAYSRDVLNAFAKILFDIFEEAVWLSDVHAIERAGNKFLQAKIALQLGFAVPSTLFTSSKIAAQRFVTNTDAVVKPIVSSVIPAKDGKPRGFYTVDLTKKKISFEGLNLAPAIFQTKIQPRNEYRVTVVGTSVFSARVSLEGWDSASHVRDWRAGHLNDSVRFEAVSLGKDIEGRCVALVKELGLSFGAIDLIEDMHGGIWSLKLIRMANGHS